jgi:hypothetical protein
MYTYDAKVWDLSIVQGPFSVAPCQTPPVLTVLSVTIRNLLLHRCMHQVTAACPLLAVLNVSHCPLVTLAGIEPQELKQLWAVGCKEVKTPAIETLCRVSNLEVASFLRPPLNSRGFHLLASRALSRRPPSAPSRSG